MNLKLIMLTAVKNITLGSTTFWRIKLIEESFVKKNEELKSKTIFDIWFKLSAMRDLARNIFHGSVLCDIMENVKSLEYFAIFGKSVSEMLDVTTQKTDAVVDAVAVVNPVVNLVVVAVADAVKDAVKDADADAVKDAVKDADADAVKDAVPVVIADAVKDAVKDAGADWWKENITNKAIMQRSQEFNDLAIKIYDLDFDEGEAQAFLNAESGFDTSLESLQKDFAKFKALGISNSLLSVKN